jgi:hypothetical protein
MNLIIDTTTDSIVFNPLSAQGQWVNHRFGKRNINYQLDSNSLIDYISSLNDIDHVDFVSVFGDPMCYTDIEKVVSFLTSHHISSTIVTYGMGDINLYKSLSDLGAYFVFKTTGIVDKVFLNADWKIVKANIDAVKNKQIQFIKFKHNKLDLKYMKELFDKVYEHDGDCIAGDMSNIVNEEGKWLYDVHTVDSNKPTLEKSLQGYHYLKHFVKKIKGKSILDNPDNFVLPNAKAFEMEQQEDIYLSVTGHVFYNYEEMQIFSNALCDDWELQAFNLDYEYEKKVYYVLTTLMGRQLYHIDSGLSN